MSAIDFGAAMIGREGSLRLCLLGCGLASGEVWAVEIEPSGCSDEEVPEECEAGVSGPTSRSTEVGEAGELETEAFSAAIASKS